VRTIPLIALAFSSMLAIATPGSTRANQTCTVIRDSGKEYVGCFSKGYDYTLDRAVNGIKTFSAAKENSHNPGCFDVQANGIIAICTYKR
jgi:hypothetical protein